MSAPFDCSLLSDALYSFRSNASRFFVDYLETMGIAENSNGQPEITFRAIDFDGDYYNMYIRMTDTGLELSKIDRLIEGYKKGTIPAVPVEGDQEDLKRRLRSHIELLLSGITAFTERTGIYVHRVMYDIGSKDATYGNHDVGVNGEYTIRLGRQYQGIDEEDELDEYAGLKTLGSILRDDDIYSYQKGN